MKNLYVKEVKAVQKAPLKVGTCSLNINIILMVRLMLVYCHKSATIGSRARVNGVFVKHFVQ